MPDGSAPPLRLPAARRQHGWFRAGWLAPVAAAAAVVAVAAASVMITRGQFAGGRAATRAGPDGTPAYYVALTGATAGAVAGAAAVVRSTSTGRSVVRVVPPRPYSSFTMVTAADDDRTFVLSARVTAVAALAGGPAGGAAAAVRTKPRPAAVTVTRFFLLRFDPSRTATRLRPLQLPPQRATVSGVALSPDGRRLAVALSPPGQLEIMIASVATGASRTWATRVNLKQRFAALPNYLSWAPGGQALAFDWPDVAGQAAGPGVPVKESVRLLNTASPGTSLLGDSTVLPVIGGEQVALPPEGKQVIFRDGPYPGGLITEYPVAILPGRPVKGSIPSPNARIQTVTRLLWTNASGSVLIVNLLSPEIDVLDNGRYVRLPATMPDNPLGIAW